MYKTPLAAIFICLLSQTLAFRQSPFANRFHLNVDLKHASPFIRTGREDLTAGRKFASVHSKLEESEGWRQENSALSSVKQTLRIATTAFVMSGGPLIASAVEDALDVEIAELPPPYVPILFSIGLVAGVGLLTGSLGDVIAEGKWLIIFLSNKVI